MLDNIIQKCINKKCKYKTLKNTSRIVINKSLKRKHNKLLGGGGASKATKTKTKYQKFKTYVSKKATRIRNITLNNPETKATKIQSMNINTKLNAKNVLKKKRLKTGTIKLAKYTVGLPITATVKIADMATKKLTNAVHYLRSDVTAKRKAVKKINDKLASVLDYQGKLHELATNTTDPKKKEALFKKLENTEKLSNKLTNKQHEMLSNSDSTLNRTLHNIGKDINYAYENKKEKIKRVFKNIGWRMAFQRNRIANNLEKTAEMYQKRIDALNSEGSGGYKLTTKQKAKKLAKLTRIRNNLIENANHNRRIGLEMKSNSMFTYFTRSAERSEIKHGRSILTQKQANTPDDKIKAVLETCPNIKKALKSMNIPVNDISKLGAKQRERLLALYNTISNPKTRKKDSTKIENLRSNFLKGIIEDKAGNNISSATFKRHKDSSVKYPPVNIRTMTPNAYAKTLNTRLATLTGKNDFNKLVSSDEFTKRAINANVKTNIDAKYKIDGITNNDDIKNIKLSKRDLAIEQVKLKQIIDDDNIDALTKINAQSRIDEIDTILGYDNTKNPEAFSKALELGNYNTIKKLIDAGNNANNIIKQINADYDIKKASNKVSEASSEVEKARQAITEINNKLSKTKSYELINDKKRTKLEQDISKFTKRMNGHTNKLKEKTDFLTGLDNALNINSPTTLTDTNKVPRNANEYIKNNLKLVNDVFNKVGRVSSNNVVLFEKLKNTIKNRVNNNKSTKNISGIFANTAEVEFIKKLVEDSANLNQGNIDFYKLMITKNQTEINSIDTKVTEFVIMTQQKKQADQKLKEAEETRKAAEGQTKSSLRTLQLTNTTNPAASNTTQNSEV